MNRPYLRFVADLILWSFAAFIAFRLRLPSVWYEDMDRTAIYVLGSLPVRFAFIGLFGLYLQSWRKIGVRDLFSIGRAAGMCAGVLFILTWLIRPYFPYSSLVPLIEGIIAVSFLGGARLSVRLWFERQEAITADVRAVKVLVVGAGEAGTMITRELMRHPGGGLVPIGFLDDASDKQGQRFVGLPVLGMIDDLPSIARKKQAEEVLIAIPSAPGSVVRRVVELADKVGIGYRIIPGVYEIINGKVSVTNIREVDVEDLLRRKPVQLNMEEIAGYIQDRVVFVSGAGGSIGSEIVFQTASFHPKRVILLGKGENSLYQLERELDRLEPSLEYVTFVGDVRNKEQLDHIFSLYEPDVIFHSAAHKHVPMMENNPGEAIINNIFGTKNLVSLAIDSGVERFVNISTDKAVNPTSVMGASKRVAEYIVEQASRRAGPGQVFVSVRFGNVLDSRGSVVPLFKQQIMHGGPITVTHPDMIRYFMTLEEAARLVLQAAGMGANGVVYVLDMGEPVKIVDLARDLIRLSGLEPDEDVEVVYTGIRPGEKLFEELLTDEEGIEASKHENIYVAPNNGLPGDRLETLLLQLFDAAKSNDDKVIRELLGELVPSYTNSKPE